MAASPHSLPFGWHALDGLLQPDRSVAGYLARRQEVTGRCHLRDCRRTCRIDSERLTAQGFGRLPIEAIKRWMRCARMEGCALDFHEEGAGGLPITALLGHAHVSIRFQCTRCKFYRTALPDQILAKLKAKGGAAGDDATVEKLASLATEPCKNCGKTAWRVDVLWPDPGGEGQRRS